MNSALKVSRRRALHLLAVVQPGSLLRQPARLLPGYRAPQLLS